MAMMACALQKRKGKLACEYPYASLAVKILTATVLGQEKEKGKAAAIQSLRHSC